MYRELKLDPTVKKKKKQSHQRFLGEVLAVETWLRSQTRTLAYMQHTHARMQSHASPNHRAKDLHEHTRPRTLSGTDLLRRRADVICGNGVQIFRMTNPQVSRRVRTWYKKHLVYSVMCVQTLTGNMGETLETLPASHQLAFNRGPVAALVVKSQYGKSGGVFFVCFWNF